MRPYATILLLGISRLLLIPAFGEILPQCSARRSAGPSLSGTHFGLEPLCSAKGTKRSSALSASARQPQTVRLVFIRLLYVGKAATEEP